MPQTHHRETMSALLATHTAIRVARDIGYPHIDVPEPTLPQACDPATVPLAELHVHQNSELKALAKLLVILYYCLVGLAILLALTVVVVVVYGRFVLPGMTP